MATHLTKKTSLDLYKKAYFAVAGTSYRGKKQSSLKHEWESDSMPVVSYTDEKGANKQKKTVFGWGLASGGALGIKEFIAPKAKNHFMIFQAKKPARVPLGSHKNISQAACGYGFTLFSTSSRTSEKVFGTGLNPSNQLGFHPRRSNSKLSMQWLVEPKPIPLPLKYPETTKVIDISCGRVHSVIVTDKEGVFALGNNTHGQCGRAIIPDEDYSLTSSVSPISDLPDDIIKCQTGYDHTNLLTSQGEVYSFGCGADGQLGLGHYESQWKPSLVGGDIKGEKIIDIVGVADTVLALNDKGDVFGWGNNEYKQFAKVAFLAPQLHTPKHLSLQKKGGPEKITSIAAGGSACALTTLSGEVYVWGFGLLGLGSETVSKDSPTLLPLPLFGASEVEPDVKVKKVFAGPFHFMALTNSGDLYSWGKNRYGCLGSGEDTDQFIPMKVGLNGDVRDVSCGADHCMAITRPMF